MAQVCLPILEKVSKTLNLMTRISMEFDISLIWKRTLSYPSCSLDRVTFLRTSPV